MLEGGGSTMSIRHVQGFAMSCVLVVLVLRRTQSNPSKWRNLFEHDILDEHQLCANSLVCSGFAALVLEDAGWIGKR